ncbi:MAG: KilA-N domain-containing protein [Defluviitaleaceae bacterium]|nr:KilA-N domain-containing protein [Defluviitaleaceae bacterium]
MIQSNASGVPHLQRTRVDPQVAVHLAQWLSPKFAVLVTQWVMDWLNGNISKGNTTLYHLQRYFEDKSNVPYGYLYMLNKTYIMLIGPLEQLGYQVSDKQISNISFRLIFCKCLRNFRHDVNNFS